MTNSSQHKYSCICICRIISTEYLNPCLSSKKSLSFMIFASEWVGKTGRISSLCLSNGRWPLNIKINGCGPCRVSFLSSPCRSDGRHSAASMAGQCIHVGGILYVRCLCFNLICRAVPHSTLCRTSLARMYVREEVKQHCLSLFLNIGILQCVRSFDLAY